jgi:hypothetical protein
MILSDEQIEELVAEPKPTASLASLLPQTVKGRHREARIDVVGSFGSVFRLIVRQAILDPDDFSVILGYERASSTAIFRLRRHNGSSHDHPNRLEATLVTGFHAHVATERYQAAGFKEDGYAEATNSYSDLPGAIRHMLSVANFEPPTQTSLPLSV